MRLHPAPGGHGKPKFLSKETIPQPIGIASRTTAGTMKRLGWVMPSTGTKEPQYFNSSAQLPAKQRAPATGRACQLTYHAKTAKR